MIGDGADGPIINAFDHSAHISDGSTMGAIVGFINADPAYKWSLFNPAERKQATLEQYAKWFGDEALNPVMHVEKDWGDEKFSDGCPVCNFPAGALWLTSHILTTPCGNVHWASTEVSSKHPGFIEGALISGMEAAKQVLQSLTETPILAKDTELHNVSQHKDGKTSWTPDYVPVLGLNVHLIIVGIAISIVVLAKLFQ
jgi:monoamine oxidase